MQIWLRLGLGTRKCLSCRRNCGLRQSQITNRSGTFEVERSKQVRGCWSAWTGRAWCRMPASGLLREMTEYTGLAEGITDALLDTYKGPPIHSPGQVFTDLAVAVADAADATSGMDRPDVARGEALAGLLRPGERGRTPPPITSPCPRWTLEACPSRL